MAELIELGYFGLFIAAFLAATVLPFSSEVVFSALVIAGMDMWWCMVLGWVPTFSLQEFLFRRAQGDESIGSTADENR